MRVLGSVIFSFLRFITLKSDRLEKGINERESVLLFEASGVLITVRENPIK